MQETVLESAKELQYLLIGDIFAVVGQGSHLLSRLSKAKEDT